MTPIGGSLLLLIAKKPAKKSCPKTFNHPLRNYEQRLHRILLFRLAVKKQGWGKGGGGRAEEGIRWWLWVAELGSNFRKEG